MSTHRNNFDLIRLVAATQVVIVHGLHYFHVPAPWLADVLGRFPGVPVFFVTSGFLLAGSVRRNPDVRSYAWNRVLRIFPALWACFAVSLAVAFALGAIPLNVVRTLPFSWWVVAQLTVFQCWQPDFLNQYATGSSLNGALWTIPVELGFYVILPAVRHVSRRVLVSLISLGIAFHYVRAAVLFNPYWLAKLLVVSPFPYVYLFLLGVLAQREWPRIRTYCEGHALHWLGGYLVLSYALSMMGLRAVEIGYGLAPLATVTLAGLVLALAHTNTGLAGRLLHGHDVSYGVYIYHMPVVNTLVILGVTHGLWLTIAITAVLAYASWQLVERPALARKSVRLETARMMWAP